MFHCNGWCFPWTLSVVAGTHVCLRWVRAKAMYDAIAEHSVTHLCGAPIVMSTLLNATPDEKRPIIPHRSSSITRRRRRPQSVLAAMTAAGFDVTHLYGLTETYGPAVGQRVERASGTTSTPSGRAFKRTRQGVRYLALEELTVMDPQTMAPRAGRRRDARRGHVPRQHRHEGLSEEPGGHRRGVRGRLVPFRRPRRAASGRLHPAQGPLEGHHHLGRREHLLDRGRGRALQAPRRRLLRRGGASRTRNGARRPAPSSSCSPARPRPRTSSSPGAASGWRATSARATSCSRKCRSTSTGKIQKFKLREMAKDA